jgi:UDP:flavonoid glycosyltransferase YjiC (YdhE family)
VICNAGFELVSECLHMGIPALVKAVSGQKEQRSNALALQRLGWGSAMRELGETDLRRWLDGVRAPAPVRYTDVAAALVDWIMAGDWRTTAALRDSLWSCTTATAN